MLKFAAEGYGSNANLSSVQASLESLKTAIAAYDEKTEGLAGAEAELRTVQADLAALEAGEEGIQSDIKKVDEELQYKTSQIDFYDDGVSALERLYEICIADLGKKQTIKGDTLLELTRARTYANNKQASIDGLNLEIDTAKMANDRVKVEWARLKGEVALMVEKQRDGANAYFGKISNDFEALREWRKFSYFSEMVDRLKEQLTEQGKTFKPYPANLLYGAVLKTKTPLKNWVDFCTTQLLREGDDSGTPMELDDEASKVQQMIEFLRERARLVEERTWPVDGFA